MSHHIVEFRDVHYRYPDGTAALNGLSLRITHGESVGIVGANGSGKSTFLMHTNGYLLPQSGGITVGDLPLNRQTRQEIRKKVGLIFQNPDDQLFMPTVFDDVAFGPLNLGLSPEEAAGRVEEALGIVGGLALKNKPPHHLSGGQKSAVAIASVIAMKPDILVMDEPASSLDPKARRYLIELLNDFEHTKIIASHDLDLILDVCERCIVIKDGRVMADGPAGTILSDKALLEENHLELPLTMQGRTSYKKGGRMNDIEKLRHLIGHWLEHNQEHAKSYREWGEKAGAAGRHELASLLREIAERTAAMDELFRQAEKACK
ncbi:MAG: ATP-binding cassette domain-containing protein [Nitrospirae bacterium]|nr:MAG: ATP-binding cassette domain-containing protein [Nitrospirota bacterium]